MAENRRLVVPFVFCAVPAMLVFAVGIYLVADTQSWSVMLQPLGMLGIVVALLIVALPVRLALYIFSLRESSSRGAKVWAATQCALPSLGVFAVGPALVERGITVPGLLLLSFFGCYFAALIVLLLHIVSGPRGEKV